jgi:hypothetical protein
VVEKLVLSDESDTLVWGVIISQESTPLSLYICYHQLHISSVPKYLSPFSLFLY